MKMTKPTSIHGQSVPIHDQSVSIHDQPVSIHDQPVSIYGQPVPIHGQPVSIHGGHSGQFCHHARNTLEEIILRYIALGFKWVGITEHLYPPSDALRYPDEVESGLNQYCLQKQFRHYIVTCRSLQKKYQNLIKIFTAFETETYADYQTFVPAVIQEFQPDYIVGSVHHVDNLCFDYSREYYHEAVRRAGGIHELYCRYFDIQYEMIQALSPAVVGHFDLIRVFDDHYQERIKSREIQKRITRNLELIQQKDLIMDFNLRALIKAGGSEPYISAPILAKVRELNIKVVPGDDSHGTQELGVNMEKGIAILKQAGFSTRWPEPALYKWN